MKNTVICIGDSLTNCRNWGNNSSPLVAFNVRLALKYPKLNFVNLGVNGDTTAGIWNRRTDANVYTPFRIIVWAGINDINAGLSASYIQANLNSIYTYYSDLNYEVYAMTITPKDTDDTAKNNIRSAVNTWITTNATGLTRVIDSWTIIRDPSNTGVRLPAYAENGDVSTPSHINDLGYAAIVSAFP